MKTSALIISALALLSFVGISQAETPKADTAIPPAAVKEQAQGATEAAVPTAKEDGAAAQAPKETTSAKAEKTAAPAKKPAH